MKDRDSICNVRENRKREEDYVSSAYGYRLGGLPSADYGAKLESVQISQKFLDIRSKLGKIKVVEKKIANIRIPFFEIWLTLSLLIGLSICSFLLLNGAQKPLALPTVKSIRKNMTSDIQIIQLPEIKTEEHTAATFSQVAISTYKLQPGDFLINIAKEFDVSIDSIITWNNITDARRIRAGDELLIPNTSGVLHTVKRGESIAELAKRYEVAATSILDTNNLDSSVITPGAKLFIPGAKMNSFQLGLVMGTIFLTPARGYISSPYGYRISPVSGKYMFHGALDIAGKLGSPIIAATYGTVSYVDYNNPVYGNMIVIKHPGGFQTLYAHLSKIYVRKGQSVGRGRTIGLMGSTGLSTGSHLHFAVILHGKAVNPRRYIRM